MTQIPDWQASTQYCAKHNQPFAAFLPMCPICRGEFMAGPWPRDEDMIPNKSGLFLTIAAEAKTSPAAPTPATQSAAAPGRPVQMELF